jgi:hypothetical protein
VHIGHESRSLGVFVVTFHKQFSGFIIQATFGKRNNEETPNHRQDVAQGSLYRPILLERIDANGSGTHVHIGMVHFREKESAGWGCWELVAKDEFEHKVFAMVRSADGTFEFALLSSSSSSSW